MNIKSWILAVGFSALAATSASALTVVFQDLGTGDSATIVDGGGGDGAPSAGLIDFSGTVGGFSVDATSLSLDVAALSTSLLSQSAFTINTTTASTLRITVWDTDFSAGASPLSNLHFGLSNSLLSGGSLEAYAQYSNDNTLATGRTTIGGALTNVNPTDSASTSALAPISDPFLLLTRIDFTTTGAGGIADFTSTVTVSPVPVPAAGLLLVTALGGMAVMRRRRKAA